MDVTQFSTIPYDLEEEIQGELDTYEYNLNKDSGAWLAAKQIIAASVIDLTKTEFFFDHLDNQFKSNKDSFDNIQRIYYEGLVDGSKVVMGFDSTIGKFIVENLKINEYKAGGYIFGNDPNANKWDFTIIIVTSKSIYCANRYVNETSIGFIA
jgi:hypothetical protein